MYAVSVTYTAKHEGWVKTIHSPTFYLDERTQGITDEEHARKIVTEWQADILDPDIEFHVMVVKL